jgi:hypothetical protein
VERTPDDVLTKPGWKFSEPPPSLDRFFPDPERAIVPIVQKSRIVAGATVKRRGAPPTPSAPDTILVALGDKFDALSAELAALQKDKGGATPPHAAALDGRLNGDTEIHPSAERIEAILALLDPIERAIMATPAVTVVGLGVKARHAAHVLSHYWIDATDTLDWDARAVRLLIESTCAVAGVALTFSQPRD